MQSNLQLIEEDLITFGQLIKIKREQMKLTISEAVKQSKITGLSLVERDIKKPTKKTYARIISFYRLTDEELSKCKISKLENIAVDDSKRISGILDLLRDVIEDLNKLDGSGLLANKLKSEEDCNLTNAYELIFDVLIIQRLI